MFSKAFLDLFFPVKTQVKFEEKTRQEIFKEEKTNGRLTVREKVGQVFCVFSLTLHLLVLINKSNIGNYHLRTKPQKEKMYLSFKEEDHRWKEPTDGQPGLSSGYRRFPLPSPL